ncbi:MAG: HD domain-containing phosphohydrolase [Pseudomonadota bacterium]
MRVLLVEDEAITRKAVAGMLSSEGYQVEQAEDGETALTLARSGTPPALILSDVLMPQMDGFSLCRALRSEPGLEKTPLIFYSAVFLSAEDEALAREVGADAFVRKGEDLSQFKQRLRQVLEGATELSAGATQRPKLPADELERQHEAVLLHTLYGKVAELENEQHLPHAERLRESERRMRTLVANLPGMAYRCDNDRHWNMHFVSEAVESLTGYTRRQVEESREVSFAELIHPEDRERVWQSVQRTLEAGESFAITYRITHRDGSLRWLEERGSGVQQGRYIEGYINDVSRQVETAEQLQRINRVLRTLSRGNRSMVAATREEELLDNVCQLLASDGGYPYVWAATCIDAERLEPRAYHGEQAQGMRPWFEAIRQLPRHRHLFAETLDSGKPYLLNDMDRIDWGEGTEALRRSGLPVLLLLPLRHRGEPLGLVGIFAHERAIFDHSELSLLQEMAGDVGFGLKALRTKLAHDQGMQRIQRTMLQTVEAVSATLEKRDPYTAGHQQRVEQLSVAVAADLGWSDWRIEGLRLAALVHDIGKIHIPSEILNRPGRLSDLEFDIIKAHPEVGYDILKGVEFDWPIATIVLQHHERCDGSGYPQALTCKDIIPEACIIAVADVVEAITSDRPYRPGLGLDIALDEIESGRGSRYDAPVVDSCLRLFRERGFNWRT